MKSEATANPLNILVLEDRASDAELMMAQLVEAGFAVVWQRVETEKDYLQSLRAGLDLIIADYQLPQFDAIHALKLLGASQLDIPFIIVSGEVGDDFIVEAMKQGAADFLLKDRMARLGTAVKQALERKYMRMTQMEGNRKLGQAMAESEGIRADLETANRALGVKNQQLSELYRTAQRFMDDVSHEFRTPLSVIKGYSEIMFAGIAGATSPDQKKFCRIIIDRTRDMAQMIDDLLDSSKLRAGSLRVDRRPCDVGTILAALHPIIDSRVAACKIQWSQVLAPGLPQIYGDAEKVVRVLVNLVVNAIKFSPEGSRLVLSATADGLGNVRISLKDEGPGISPENIALIFERFRQVGNGFGSTKGFGLGLNIAQELVALNLGTMNVTSEPQSGSTFSFTLPVNDPEVVLDRLIIHLKNIDTPPGSFAVLRVSQPRANRPEDAHAELRGFLACSSHPRDLIMAARDDAALILFGYSASPTGWHRRMVKAGRDIEQFSPSQKLCAFEVELVETVPYPVSLSDAAALVLKHLQAEVAYA
jgi:signal transduction histidine kinase